MRITPKFSAKVDALLKSLGYKVRYELGNFQGGYCVVDTQKLIVVNKYYTLEGRVNTLLEFLGSLDTQALFEVEDLSPEQKKFLQEILSIQPSNEIKES